MPLSPKKLQGVAAYWEKFVVDGELEPGVVRSPIAESWRRCMETRVKPDKGICTRFLESDELRDLQEKQRDLIGIARPFMTHLYEYFKGSGYIVMLCDEQGYIMEAFGDEDTLKKADRGLNFVKGACWTEDEVGTNAIGTALSLKRPIQVSASEHYCLPHHAWTCSATPIFDPDGQLVGILDVSGPSDRVHPHTLGMVVAAVDAIREQMLMRQKNRELTLALNNMNNIIYSISDGLITFDGLGIIKQFNPAAEQIIGRRNSEVVGASFKEILGLHSGLINKILLNHDSFHDVEVILDNKNGQVHCLASAKPIIDDRGIFNGGLMLVRPIQRIQKLVNRFSGAEAKFCFEDIIGCSPELKETIHVAALASSAMSNVLLQGESGTGKELFAQAIHNSSHRSKGPFVAINCGAIPRDLIASELFGYEDGAFTGAKRGGRPGKFELSSGGTLFLDEIGDMPLEQQVALLRVLQDKKVTRIGGDKTVPVDVRVICATNKNLSREVEKGNFRQDLFYRVNVITINIPPLRERPADIPVLFHYYLERTGNECGKQIAHVDPEVVECLSRYRWPGNVRELQNVVERMISVAEQDRIGIDCLPAEINGFLPAPEEEPTSVFSQAVKIAEERERRKRQQSEKEHQQILSLLAFHGGNLSRVAKELGYSRTTLYRKIKLLGIEY